MLLRSQTVISILNTIVSVSYAKDYQPANKKLKLSKSPPTSFVSHPQALPRISPNALINFEEKATPLLKEEKEKAQNTFKSYVAKAVLHKLRYNDPIIPGYPKYDPNNPSHKIHSIIIPSERHMTEEQIKIINNKIHEPVYKTFKKEMLKLADDNMKSLDIYNSDGKFLGEKRINVIPDELIGYWDMFERFHIEVSFGYSGGCPAALKQDLHSMDFQLKNEKTLSSAGLKSVPEIHAVHANNEESTNTSTRAHYTNKDGEKKSFTFANWLDFNNMNEKVKDNLWEINPLPQFLHNYYIDQAPRFLAQHNITSHYQDIIMSQVRNKDKLSFGSASLNEGTSRMCMHYDSKSPLPTMLSGSTNYSYDADTGKITKIQNGGLLFIADGLVPLPYTHRDIVLLNPDVFHGVSTLQGLPNTTNKVERTRFSCVMSWRYDKQKNESWNAAFKRKGFK